MKKALFVVNPHSGKGAIRGKLLDIFDILTRNDYFTSVHITQYAGDGYSTVKNRAMEFDVVIASGGDGTLNEVIRGVMELPPPARPKIGYLPSGTVNDFASNLKIPKNPLKACHAFVQGNDFCCDVGKFNHRSFVYVAAFGALTNVPYETPQQNKNALGHLAYFLEGIKQLYAIPSFKLSAEFDFEHIQGEFMLGMVSNSNYIAGFKTVKAQKAQLNDGLFEVMLIKKPGTLAELSEIIAQINDDNIKTDAIRIFRTSKVSFVFEEPAQWTLDGEFGGAVKTADITVEKEAVTLII